MKTLRNILISLVILTSARLSAEPIGDIISYQGKLTDANGNPVENKTHTVIFKIYENGTEKFSQTFDNINTLGGVFSVFLGGSVPLPNFDPGNEYKLGIAADGGTETTHQIASVPVAKIAEGNVKKSGDTMTGNLDMGGKFITGLRLISGPPGSALDITTADDQGSLMLQSFRSGTTYIGYGGGKQDLWVSGKGEFKGGLNADLNTITDSTGINGEGQRVGVRGFSYEWSAVKAETYAGDAFNAGIRGPNANFLSGYYSADGLTWSRRVRIDSNGRGYFEGGTQNSGADYADLVKVSGKANDYGPGDVLVIGDSPSSPFRKSSTPYSKNVAGIYSTKPGVLGSKRGIEPAADNEVPLALTGIVPCKVSCENGPIRMGDLLVTSRTPGYAMKGTNNSKMLGAVLGKALQPLNSGKGVIEVLVVQR